jgi:carboxypeptidase D
MGNFWAFSEFPALQVIQSYPQLIGFNTTVYEYIVDQYNLCGFNITLKYPNPEWYPTLKPPKRSSSSASTKDDVISLKETLDLYDLKTDTDETMINGKRFRKRQTNYRRASTPHPQLPPKGVLNSDYRCSLVEFIQDWAVNFTAPWVELDSFDDHRASNALNPTDPTSLAKFLNDKDVRAAIHAPKKTWKLSLDYPFNNGDTDPGIFQGDRSKCQANDQIFCNLTTNYCLVFIFLRP